ncbi:LysM peptidoglycan-binding domain-containing protein [bacterium]|nr:LysM peptidoglycan-binding domain-containing protein [bacterium]
MTAASAQEWQTHVVRRGENLTLIARRYDVQVQQLRDWNDLRSDELAIGQKLRIPQIDEDFYVVKGGDHLTGIAEAHDVTVALLKQWNGLRGNTIQPGQRLRVRPAPRDEAVHVVAPGETLSEIAERHGLGLARLKSINDLDDDRISVGQKLRLRQAEASVHIVEKGDALWEIARAYGVSVEHLKELNGLHGDRIYVGQELKLDGAAATVRATYRVKKGDSLSGIARLHQMSLSELRSLNDLRGSVIHPGQVLNVRPRPGTARAATPGDLSWQDLLGCAVPGVPLVQGPNGPYYYFPPQAYQQKSRNYFEESRISPPEAYRQARRLWDAFAAAVDRMEPLGNDLAGWHFVLDPGHGGIDPGTIVKGKDENGKTFYIVEDEYVHDIALRVYVLLRLHGARVTLTLLSPNHLLRQSEPVTSTFVHDRNEVFNSAEWNRRNRPSTWPKGGQKYLDARIDVAKRAFRDAPADRTVFLSFHADNVPAFGEVVSLFYFQNATRTDTVSRGLARGLLPAMGAGARATGKNLGVLRHNPARYKLLVEMRNLAYEDHIWSIRYEELRQRDAEKVVQALRQALPRM